MVHSAFDQILTRTLALDLEIARSGDHVRHIGAVFRGEIFQWTGGRAYQKALRDLDAFGGQAHYVLGHNILNHDLPFLKAVAPGMQLLELPVLDTLYLSPLAFPRNPYHRLVKDYKLVRSSLSDPLEDVKLAISVFKDQCESFANQSADSPDLLSFYRFCFQHSAFSGFSGRGLAEVFRLSGAEPIEDETSAMAVFRRLSDGAVCAQTVTQLLNSFYTEPPAGPVDSSTTPHLGPVAAYALAWLTVAGSNSVLPAWVRHQFPEIVPFLKALRDVPCGDSACAYCRQMHDPDRQLQRFFGFDGFREKPQSPDGHSLQRAIVLSGMQDAPLLAILPTGGGKSLCFQLPALVRHMRRGQLTVVISPLQALMKDQVDNLIRNTGTPFAAAVYGLLTPPERGEVLQRVRLGDIAILYLSPEQLRSKSVIDVLSQREIGCWVFDEAHCLSKWGHDFRPDYMYAARFIREFSDQQKLPMPPIACYTATAKPDVIQEIKSYFQSELNQTLQLYEGGVERGNLTFQVRPVSGVQKLEQTYEIVTRHLEEAGTAGAIVYAAKRKTTEEIRDYLLHKGLLAEAFHAGVDPNLKRRIIEDFVAGRIPVICATNAFGMGIDKSDIRLVLHYDIPGSLENYLQEAGRAGRDLQPATCILLYDPVDGESQFELGALSQVKKDEIQRILRSLKRCKRNRNNDIVVTIQELLRDEDLVAVFDKWDRSSDTKIRTAVSWLERADFLQRNQNLTQVFAGKPLVKSIAQAEPLISRLNLSPDVQRLWRGILLYLFNAPADRGLSADDIAENLYVSADELKKLERHFGLTPSQVVIHAMHDMAAAGLLDKGMLLSAFVQPRGKNNAIKRFNEVCALEERLAKFLQEEAPDAQVGDWLELDLGRVNQRLKNADVDSNPVSLRNLVKGLALDGMGLAGSRGSIELQHVSRNRYRVCLQRSWAALLETAVLRRNVAGVIVRELVDKAKKSGPESGEGSSGDRLVEFSANELAAGIKGDMFLHAQVQKPLAAIDRALMFLHEHKIITLQNGLAVFRQAMTIRMNPDAVGRKYTTGDYKPLAVHYGERRYQIHVMVEYATLAMGKIAQALRYVLDYFSLPRGEFGKKYFQDREDLLLRATGAESYRHIVESLNNPTQIGIVAGPAHASRLVLAGPGSGKTRIVVHRCAYLLRVARIPAHRILVMCFNHHAAVSLRKRLNELVGKDARGVMVTTYHGAAMRLAGISLRILMENQKENQGGGEIDFNDLIREATTLLKGEKQAPGMDSDELREQLLQGFSHILVDEYQDIDQDQYELVSAIAGRTLEEGEGRLAIMAVGDDDQNVYAFRGANIEFIRRFQQDYKAGSVYMVENYRSSAHIIQAANHLIEQNRDRMKTRHPIRINRQRKTDPPGGIWEKPDTLVEGRVQRLTVKNPGHQAISVYREIERLKSLKPSFSWENCAVLARTRQALAPLRNVFEQNAIPVAIGLSTGLPLHRIREFAQYTQALKTKENEIRRASELAPGHFEIRGNNPLNYWHSMLAEMHAAYLQETADAQLPVSYFIDWLYEALAEKRREKTFGRGLFLNTVHAAKGLEFDHVFLVDGGWNRPMDDKTREEERRLLYVGMTRAKETLCILEFETNGNPLIKKLAGPWVINRRAPFAPAEDAMNMPPRNYHIIGLKDIYLSYAGTYPHNHLIHRHLHRLNAGDPLRLIATGSHVEVHNTNGIEIARLSREGSRTWAEKVYGIEEARVLAILQWHADDSPDEYRRYAKVACWELPLIEVTVKERGAFTL